MERRITYNRVTVRGQPQNSSNLRRINRPPQTRNSLFPLSNLQQTLGSSRSLNQNRPIQRNSQNSSNIVCPKCTSNLAINEIETHLNQCSYRKCNWCQEFYPQQLIENHKKFLIYFKINILVNVQGDPKVD